MPVYQESFIREVYDLKRRLAILEKIYQTFGEELIAAINGAKITNNSITSSKIASLAADKLTSGTISALSLIDIGDAGSGNYIRIDGGEVRIVMYKSGVAQFVIGDV